MTIPLYYRYWGKAKVENDDGPAYHLLPYHCLDVAAVGACLLDVKSDKCRQLARQLQVKPDWLSVFFVFCLALHDLGKFARAFQGLKEDLSDSLVKPNSRMSYNQRHDSLGFWLWINSTAHSLAKNTSAFNSDTKEINTIFKHMEQWLEIVTGHHGQPPIKQSRRLENYFQPDDEQAALAFVQDVLSLLLDNFDASPLLDKSLKKRLQSVSWQLAGMAVLADWLGSNQAYFPYLDQVIPLEEYWKQIALPNAVKAIQALPEQAETQVFFDIKQLFGFIEKPTPLQNYAIEAPLSQSAQLFILEDVTGAGKTEAALVLAQRLMGEGLANGIYIALPTMATANAMYERLGKVYRKFYQPENNPSLILAHGARDLSTSFKQSVFLPEQGKKDADYLNGRNEDEQEQTATAFCNAWLADSRKKALLADIGVGTLDQALLAVLPARHQSLRLLGLSRKILLVDEVHAYDSYMQKLLNALLEAHARQGGSVILLSATLPREMRKGLVKAFHQGLDTDAPELTCEDYPLVTHTPTGGEIEQPLDTREEVKRTVQVERLASEKAVLEKIQNTVAAGQCVCWIRNTVKDARRSYQDLLDDGLCSSQLSMFHSRFAMCDRQQVESQTLTRFGKDSTADDRKGKVLIATQVVEQSLDLDFDVLLTDLAPIDLIIQRAGRLQRHVRDSNGNRLTGKAAKDQRGSAVLYLFSPEPLDDVNEDWLKPEHAGTQAVYRHVGQLWLTAKKLLGKPSFAMPEDARELIEGVYSGDEPYPEALDNLSWNAEGDDACKKSMAELNALKLSKGYTYASGDWDEETRIPTRLSEQETVSVALAVWQEGVLKPYATHSYYAWALSTVKLPESDWKKARQAIPEEFKHKIETLKAETKALRWLEIFPLTDATANFYSASDGWQSPTGEDK
ncbi:MAG: CRISPR-associated helicase Cas3' [Gammaproteobacteria bacterium]